MALRFRRSFRIAPGIRMNVTGSGASLSVGPRGSSVTFGRRGTFFNAGFPGTGFSSRTRLDSPAGVRRHPTKPNTVTVEGTVRIDQDAGTISFLDSAGNPMPPEWVARAKRQQGDKIRAAIERACDNINARIESLAAIHVHTPAPHERLRYELQKYSESRPEEPMMAPHGFLGWLFKSTRARIDAENASRQSKFQAAVVKWKAAKAAFEESEWRRKVLLEERVLTDVDAMEEVLEGSLQGIEWPRETIVSAEVDEAGRLVLLDVDLPEIEDMPKTTASVPGKGYKLNVKEMSPAKLQKLYMQHVHGIGFRIIGEVFAVLPKSEEVVLSAFSQRADKATGEVRDEYLYSVRVTREQWAKISFDNLQGLDVIAALERFELRRDMSKTGIFQAVQPLLVSSATVRAEPSVGESNTPRAV
ncbi:MAG TPA: DUF4236 domain-containing protein [Burkholderiales bacterium]|nr:DUF4236 domain-containing protein [Burkholderiales bacterium]